MNTELQVGVLTAGTAFVGIGAGFLGNVALERMRGSREDIAAEKARVRDALYGLQEAVVKVAESQASEAVDFEARRTASSYLARINDRSLEDAMTEYVWALCEYNDALASLEDTFNKMGTMFDKEDKLNNRIRELLHGSPPVPISK